MAPPSTAVIGAHSARLVLETEMVSPDDLGGRVTTHVAVATVWAQIRWVGGSERRQGGRIEDRVDTRISLRWRAGIAPGQRFRLGARLFHIVAVGDPDGSRKRLVCLCEERTS